MSKLRKLRSSAGGAVSLLLAIGYAALAQRPPSEQHLRELLAQAIHASKPQPWAYLLIHADAEAPPLDPKGPGRTISVPPFGELHYKYNGIAQQWEYQHDLLRRVVRELNGTRAGADALAELLGFGPYGVWLDNDELSPDRFPSLQIHRKVISITNAPAWRKLNDVRLTRFEAEAYETWWSLSRAAPGDPELSQNNVSAADYAAGADAARLQAVRLYERVLVSKNEPALRDRVAKLRRREDTAQRAWFRVGD
jgi:hypothetical protein